MPKKRCFPPRPPPFPKESTLLSTFRIKCHSIFTLPYFITLLVYISLQNVLFCLKLYRICKIKFTISSRAKVSEENKNTLFFAILSLVLGGKKRRREENKNTLFFAILSLVLGGKKRRKQKYAFLCHFDADSRKQGAKRRNDLEVVTELSNAADDEDAQNGKEKTGSKCAISYEARGQRPTNEHCLLCL